MFQIFRISIIVAIVANTLLAYQVELDLNSDISFAAVEHENGDANIGVDLDGSFYFEDVNTENVVLEEAAFLTKASSIGVELGYKANYHGLSRRFEETAFGDYRAIKGKTVVNDYILAASYNYAKLTDNGDVDNITQKKLLFSFGKYLTDTSAFLVSYVRYEDARDFKNKNLIDREDNGVDISYKAFDILENGQSISYGGNLAILDTNIVGIPSSKYTNEYGAHISYYPTENVALKLHAMIKNFDANHIVDKRQAYKFSARYYFFESFAMNLNLGQIYGEDELGKVEGAIIDLGFRFRY